MIKVEVWKNLKKRSVDVVVVPILLYPGELGWDSKLDRAIKELTGTLYYKKLMAYALQGKLKKDQIFFVMGSRENHKGTFDYVMFVPLTGGPAAKTLYRALIFAHENEMKDILVPLSPDWLDSPVYLGIGREYPGYSLEILQMSLALAEDNIEGIDLTVNFAPCDDSTWSRRLIYDLRKEYGSDSKKESFWGLIKECFGRI